MITNRICTLYTDVFTSDIEYLWLLIIISPETKISYRVIIEFFFFFFFLPILIKIIIPWIRSWNCGNKEVYEITLLNVFYTAKPVSIFIIIYYILSAKKPQQNSQGKFLYTTSLSFHVARNILNSLLSSLQFLKGFLFLKL